MFRLAECDYMRIVSLHLEVWSTWRVFCNFHIKHVFPLKNCDWLSRQIAISFWYCTGQTGRSRSPAQVRASKECGHIRDGSLLTTVDVKETFSSSSCGLWSDVSPDHLKRKIWQWSSLGSLFTSSRQPICVCEWINHCCSMIDDSRRNRADTPIWRNVCHTVYIGLLEWKQTLGAYEHHFSVEDILFHLECQKR